MILADPQFGISVKAISGNHEEFVEGSNVSEVELRTLFEESVDALSGFLKDGAIVDLFIDGRSLALLATVLKRAGFEQKAICAWDKQAGGLGSLYRHQIEFVIVSKCRRAAHTNNVQLGRFKRNRTTLWSSPGLAQFGSGRAEALDLHPTSKPIGLLADALLDTSNPGEIILDPFCGTGSTLLACERTGRVGHGLELDPKHVDTSIHRLEQEVGREAVHVETELTFAETRQAREAKSERPYVSAGGEDWSRAARAQAGHGARARTLPARTAPPSWRTVRRILNRPRTAMTQRTLLTRPGLSLVGSKRTSSITRPAGGESAPNRATGTSPRSSDLSQTSGLRAHIRLPRNL